jgi:hypothetical protein
MKTQQHQNGDLHAAQLYHEHAARTDRLTRALEHNSDIAEAQHKRSRLFTATFTSSIATAGQLFPNLHLPEESAIAGAYIENNSAIATLTT